MPRTAGFSDFFQKPGYLLTDVDVKMKERTISPHQLFTQPEGKVEQENYGEFDPLGACCFSHNVLVFWKWLSNSSSQRNLPDIPVLAGIRQQWLPRQSPAILGIVGDGDAVYF